MYVNLHTPSESGVGGFGVCLALKKKKREEKPQAT